MPSPIYILKLYRRSNSRIGIRVDQISVDTAVHQDQILRRVEQAELSVLNAVSTRNIEQEAALEGVTSGHRQIERRVERNEEVIASILRSQQDSHRMIRDLIQEISR